MNWNHSELGSLGIGITKNRESLGMRITMNRESLGIGVAVNWGRLDFVTLTYSSRRKPKKKRPARCGLGPLSAEEPPYGPFFVRGGRVEVVKL